MSTEDINKQIIQEYQQLPVDKAIDFLKDIIEFCEEELEGLHEHGG